MKRFFGRIGYVLYWIPCLWRVWWWDGSYVLDILRHALKYNARAYRKWGHLENRNEVADQIEQAVALLDRLIADAYTDEDLHRWSEKWGDWVWKPCEDRPGFSELVGFENEKTLEDTEQIHKECRAMDEKYNRLRTADMDALFVLLRNRIDEWWD